MKWNEIFCLEGSVSYAVVRGGLLPQPLCRISVSIPQCRNIWYSDGKVPLLNFCYNSGPEVRVNYLSCSRPEACVWYYNSALLPQPLCESRLVFHSAGIFDIPMVKSLFWISATILGRKSVRTTYQCSRPEACVWYYNSVLLPQPLCRISVSIPQRRNIWYSDGKVPLLNFCNSGQLREF